jgi:DNA-binding GntR family transcriptional regulator
MAAEGVRARKLNELKTRLTEYIASGEVPPGAFLPSERELSDQFDSSRHLVHHALTILQASGIVSIEPGIGTRVLIAPARYTESRNLADPAGLIEATGEPKPSGDMASALDASMFGIEESDPLLVLNQAGRHRVTGAPVLLTRTLPAEAVIRIRPRPDPFGERSALLVALTAKHGPLTATERVRFLATPLPQTADALDMEPGEITSIVEMRRFHRTAAGRLLMIEAQTTSARGLEWEWDL